MAAALSAALGLDRPELQKACIAVLEHGSADSSFVLSCIMWDWLVGRPTRTGRAMGSLLPRTPESSSAVLLITSHHSLCHYRVQSLKLGLNLPSFKQRGTFDSLELLSLLSDTLHTSDTKSDSFKEDCSVVLQNLYSKIRTTVQEMTLKYKSVCLIVENIDNMTIAGATLSEVIIFLNYLRGLTHEYQGLSLVVSAHISNHEEQHSTLKAFLLNICSLSISVAGLQTGLCKDISGSLHVMSNLTVPCLYHFRLLDRQIKIFAPGTS